MWKNIINILWEQGVMGSSPVTPTTLKIKHLQDFLQVLF